MARMAGRVYSNSRSTSTIYIYIVKIYFGIWCCYYGIKTT